MQLWDPTMASEEVECLGKHIRAGMTVLDIGSNEGPHTFFFADRGCQVVALEPNPETFVKLKEKIARYGNQIELLPDKLLAYKPARQFDVIISTMVLHFFAAEDIQPAIAKTKSWTKPNGYNVISAYTNQNPPGKRPYLFGHNELLSYYEDWKTIEYAERPTPWFIFPEGTRPRRNQAVYLTAQKPG